MKGLRRPIKFVIRHNRDFYQLVNHVDVAFGALDLRTSFDLMALQAHVQHLYLEAVLIPRPPDNDENTLLPSNEVQDAAINILGSRQSAETAGALLGKARRNLQHPLLLDYGINYSNPQFLVVPGSNSNLNEHVKSRSDSSDFQNFLSEAVSELFESLDRVEEGIEIPLSECVKTPLLK